jgi:hypothetical protein
MEDMLGFQPGRWLSFAWTYTAPATIISIFLFSIIRYEPLNYADTYEYPWWGELLGWAMGAASILCIPTYALLYLLRQSGSWKQRLRTGLTCAALARKENDRSYIQDDASALDVMLQTNPQSEDLTD